MSTDHVFAVHTAIDALAGLLAVAEGLAMAGRKVDLAGLDSEMARLCAAAMALEPDAGRGLRGGMATLLVQLDQLSVALRHHA